MEKMSMQDLLDQYESVDEIHKGDIVEGEIISQNDQEWIIQFGYRADGIIEVSEIPFDMLEELEVGDKLTAMVTKTGDADGNVQLSVNSAQSIVVWDELKRKLDHEVAFEVKVKEVVKGGVVAVYRTARIFIPASQIDVQYVEALEPYVGHFLRVKLIEVDLEKKKAVASSKVIKQEVLDEEKKRQLASLSEGDVLEGTVVRLADYGAFINIGYVDGLAHVSQLSWKRVKHPSEVVQEGDRVEVEILSVDREKEKIALKVKDVQDNPWHTMGGRYAVDQTLKGLVTRLAKFGAFVELQEGLEGLIHISEIDDRHLNHPSEVLSVGDEVEVRILAIDEANQKISLSMKDIEEVFEWDIEDEEDQNVTLADVWGDKLKGLKL